MHKLSVLLKASLIDSRHGEPMKHGLIMACNISYYVPIKLKKRSMKTSFDYTIIKQTISKFEKIVEIFLQKNQIY